MTSVSTPTLAAITERRAGTAANVVRISPVPYSPVIATAPMAPAASIMIAHSIGIIALQAGAAARVIETRPAAAGAAGFLVKDMALDDILAAIRVVASGDGLIAPSVTRRLIKETRLLAKLDARDRVRLVILAYETGLVAPPG
ncbi:hypothetical protein ACWFRQ_14305 [Streptomyces niveus]